MIFVASSYIFLRSNPPNQSNSPSSYRLCPACQYEMHFTKIEKVSANSEKRIAYNHDINKTITPFIIYVTNPSNSFYKNPQR